LTRQHIAQSGKNKGQPVNCPARVQCTLKDENGNPAPHYANKAEAYAALEAAATATVSLSGQSSAPIPVSIEHFRWMLNHQLNGGPSLDSETLRRAYVALQDPEGKYDESISKILQLENCPQEILAAEATSETHDHRGVIASNSATDSAILTHLATDKNSVTRNLVAKNPATSEIVLE